MALLVLTHYLFPLSTVYAYPHDQANVRIVGIPNVLPEYSNDSWFHVLRLLQFGHDPVKVSIYSIDAWVTSALALPPRR